MSDVLKVTMLGTLSLSWGGQTLDDSSNRMKKVWLLLAYLIYNRFLYRKGVTHEDLPDTMTYEEKQAFIDDGNARLKKSKWMMLIILPLVVTFLIDTFDLFILEMFR